jgi:hypothetical protein
VHADINLDIGQMDHRFIGTNNELVLVGHQ